MELKKTIVLPDTNPKALDLMRKLIFDEPYVLFVVLGDSPTVDLLLDKANKFSGLTDEPRWVVWARNPKLISSIYPDLKGELALLQGLRDALGFTLSIQDQVADVILSSDTIDNVRVNLAYLNAEAL